MNVWCLMRKPLGSPESGVKVIPLSENVVNAGLAKSLNLHQSNVYTFMRFNLFIPAGLKRYFDQEIRLSASALSEGNLAKSWQHLERAHILGQAYPIEHTYAHWKMLRFGFHIKSGKEIRGQLLRLLVGGVKSFVGKIPEGNTGGADVDPLLPMPIPADLEKILRQYR